MALTYSQDRERETDVSIDENGRITIQHTEKFYVESEVAMSTAAVREQLDFGVTDEHDFDPATRLKGFKVKQLTHRNPWRYEVTKTYSNNTPTAEDREDDNPLNSPPEIRWEDADIEIAISKDRDGQTILQPNKRPFNPPITMLLPGGRLLITRNERVLDVDPDASYRKHVNANVYAGKEAGTLLLKSISSHRASKNGIVYFPHDYVFEWNPLGWNEEVLNQDTVELLFGKWSPILDEKYQPVTDPVPIDDAGAAVPPASLPGGAHYQTVNKYPEADFATFRFPI